MSLKVPLVGLGGERHSGKSYLANWLVRKRNYLELSFADRMKVYAKHAFGISSEVLWGPSEGKEAVIPFDNDTWLELFRHLGGAQAPLFTDLDPLIEPMQRVQARMLLNQHWGDCGRAAKKGVLSVRMVLQTLGTEWGRHVHPDLWPKFLYEIAIPSIQSGKALPYLQEVPAFFHARLLGSKVGGVVVSDHRFENEVVATIAEGGKVFWLPQQPGAPESLGVPGHVSERKEAPEGAQPLALPFFENDEQADRFLSAIFPAQTPPLHQPHG